MAEFMMVRRLRENSSKHRRPLDLKELTDAQIVEQYRFSYRGIQRIAELLHEELADGRVHRSKVSPELQVACALGYVASPGFFSNVGFPLGLSTTTAYIAAMRVLQALANRADEFLRWPSDEEMRISEAEFRARGLPEVVGVLDGTHIQIQAPEGPEKDQYYCPRYKCHTVNAVCVVDSKGRPIFADVSQPGGSHDSFVLQGTTLWTGYEEGRLHGRLLGDAAYPVKSWLLPPIPNPTTPLEHRYNQVHGRERRLVERTYGQFKRSCHSMHSEVRVTGERWPHSSFADYGSTGVKGATPL